MRWLIPIVTVFALVGQAVTSYAAAGVIGEASCCCPVKAKCKCHDHDRDRRESPTLKRCGGEAKIVVPVQHAVAIPPIDTPSAEVIVRWFPPSDPLPVPDDRVIEPETPPF